MPSARPAGVMHRPPRTRSVQRIRVDFFRNVFEIARSDFRLCRELQGLEGRLKNSFCLKMTRHFFTGVGKKSFCRLCELRKRGGKQGAWGGSILLSFVFFSLLRSESDFVWLFISLEFHKTSWLREKNWGGDSVTFPFILR